MFGKWSIQQAEYSDQTKHLLCSLMEEFCRIFGYDTMHNQDCIIYNDPESPCPYFFHALPLKIRLSQSSLNYWSQTVYQLSHEMCHYALHQTRGNTKVTLSWFEEIICEAMSLYSLDYIATNWSRCKLSQWNPGFYKSHKTYLDEFLAQSYTNELELCNTVTKLKNHEKNKTAEKKRSGHRHQRNQVYRAIVDSPMDVRYLLDYRKYLQSNGVTIDFDKWLADTPCKLIKTLQATQPVKVL